MMASIALNEQETMATGNKIKQLRESKGLTQPQLAELAEISKNTVLNIEKGTTVPDFKTLKFIAKALGVKVISLLDEDYSPSEDEDLEALLEGVKGFDQDEKEVVRALLEAMHLKHQARKLTKKGRDQEG